MAAAACHRRSTRWEGVWRAQRSDQPGIVVALDYAFLSVIFPSLKVRYLARAKYGPATLEQLAGMWSIICPLSLSNLLLPALNIRRIAGVCRTRDDDASAAAFPIFNTASLDGFRAVIAVLAVVIVLGTWPGSP